MTLRPLLLLLAAIAATPTAASAADCIPADILSVQDGNTLQARIKGRAQAVRLLGYDTPDLGFRADCEAEDGLAVEARHRLMELIREAVAPELCPQRGVDQYGRVRAHLLLDGEDVAERLIAEGLAHPPDSHESWCD